MKSAFDSRAAGMGGEQEVGVFGGTVMSFEEPDIYGK